MRKMFEILALWVAVLVLSGCGGGGSDGGSQSMRDHVAMEGDMDMVDDKQDEAGETQEPSPDGIGDMESDHETPEPEIVVEVDEPGIPDPVPVVQDVATLLGDLIAESDMVIDASTIDADIWETTVQATPASLSLANMTSTGGFGVPEFERLEDRRGVSLGSSEQPSVIGELFDFAGWMEHSFFLVSVTKFIADDPLHPSTSVHADVYSIGEAAGSNPISGSGSWRGVMAGVDTKEGANKGNRVEGDATISIASFASSSVDVAFTSIMDTETGGSRTDMRWSSLALSNGAFDHNGDLQQGVAYGDEGNKFNSLTGRFYGPDHEEVGGVFIRNQISGAFGGTR